MDTSEMTRRRLHGEDGQALILSLVFLAVFGIVIAAVLSQTTSSLKTTSIVADRAQGVYAADAGIEYALGRLRLDSTACTEISNSFADQTINGRTVHITCPVQSGISSGAGGWAVITTGDLTKQSGAIPVNIDGPTFVTGNISVAGGGSIAVTNGSLFQHKATCPSGGQPAGVTVGPTPPYAWQCTTSAAPVPVHVLPPAPTAVQNPNGTGTNACKVFTPGKYTTAPVLGNNGNYFISGVYYFEDIGAWSIPNSTTIVGGTPSAPPSIGIGLAPCASDPSPGTNGYGVEWIFGGTSSLTINNSAANGGGVELHARVPATGDASTANMGIYAVPDNAVTGYKKSVAAGNLVLDVTTGGADVVVHGVVYGPTANMNVFASEGTTAVLVAGVVAHDLALKASSAGTGLAVSVIPAEIQRIVALTATVTSGGQGIKSQALVEIRNNTSRATVVVDSRRTG
jgi:hypothetical protein